MALLARRITHLVAGLLAASVVLVATARAADPPPPPSAQPDLAAMAIGVKDLPRGATVTDQGATKFPGAEAAYERSFELSRRAARKAGFEFLDSSVALFQDVPTASSLFAGVRRYFASSSGRRAVARETARELGIASRRVEVGTARNLQVGDDSFGLLVTARMSRLTVREVIAMGRVDRVIAEVDTVRLGSTRNLMRRTRAMLGTSAQHIRAGLAPVLASR